MIAFPRPFPPASQTGLYCRMSAAKLYIRACVSLHNFLIEQGDTGDNQPPDPPVATNRPAPVNGQLTCAGQEWQRNLVQQAYEGWKAHH